jgi:hypothetical protein
MQLKFMGKDGSVLFVIALPVKNAAPDDNHLSIHFAAKKAGGKKLPLDKLPDDLEAKYKQVIDALAGQNVFPLTGYCQPRSVSKSPDRKKPGGTPEEYNVEHAIFHGSTAAKALEEQIQPALKELGFVQTDEKIMQALMRSINASGFHSR